MSASVFYALMGRVKAAHSPEELGFIICNETRALVDYRQAALLKYTATGRAQLVAHSGLWLAAVAKAIAPQCAALPEGARVMSLSAGQLSPSLAQEWDEWLPAHVWVLALAGPNGQLHALLILARDTT